MLAIFAVYHSMFNAFTTKMQAQTPLAAFDLACWAWGIYFDVSLDFIPTSSNSSNSPRSKEIGLVYPFWLGEVAGVLCHCSEKVVPCLVCSFPWIPHEYPMSYEPSWRQCKWYPASILPVCVALFIIIALDIVNDAVKCGLVTHSCVAQCFMLKIMTMVKNAGFALQSTNL